VSLSAQIVDGVSIVVKEKAITMYEIKNVMRESNVDVNTAANILIRQKLEESEIADRKIKVSSSEVYEDIKKTARKNNMSVSQFYEAVLNSNAMTSQELKAEVKKKLLSQKLYSSIAYGKLSQPSESEIEEYYDLNKASFTYPSAFKVVIYQSENKALLAQKVRNPMFNSSDITVTQQVLEYDKISPDLARVLSTTPLNGFTQVIQNTQGGYMTFYIKELLHTKEAPLEMSSKIS